MVFEVHWRENKIAVDMNNKNYAFYKKESDFIFFLFYNIIYMVAVVTAISPLDAVIVNTVSIKIKYLPCNFSLNLSWQH